VLRAPGSRKEELPAQTKEVVHVMTHRLTGCRTGPMCACGAQAKDGADACEKCISRSRWLRRKARRAFNDD
jgi:hypothetical protein